MTVSCAFTWPAIPDIPVTLAFTTGPEGVPLLVFLVPGELAPVPHLTVILPAAVEIESLAAWLMDKGAEFWAPVPGDDNPGWDQLHRQGIVDRAVAAGEIAQVEDAKGLLRFVASPDELTADALLAAMTIEEEHGCFYNPNFARLLLRKAGGPDDR